RRGPHPPPGALDRRGRTRPAPLPPAAARTSAHGTGQRRRPSPRLPAGAGPAARAGGCLMARRRPSPVLDLSSQRWSLMAAGACLLPLLLQLPGNVATGITGLGLLALLLSWRRRLPAWPRPLLALAL